MMKIVHRAETRGRSCNNWLRSYHTFSCDDYYDAERINFGALRVLNDNRIAPGMGFSIHPHKNMEIVTIPLKGELQHGDSKKVHSVIGANDVQVISAGTGIFHSETNGSKINPVEFLQIWIMPRERNVHPNYQSCNLSDLKTENGVTLIASPDEMAPMSLLQDAWISVYSGVENETLQYQLNQSHNGVYLFLIDGEVLVGDVLLKKRDGMGLSEVNNFEATVVKDAHLLLVEVPM